MICPYCGTEMNKESAPPPPNRFKYSCPNCGGLVFRLEGGVPPPSGDFLQSLPPEEGHKVTNIYTKDGKCQIEYEGG